MNDTTATLLAGSYGPTTQSVLVGVMLGTATNVVYQEQLDDIPVKAFHADTFNIYKKSSREKTMIIDTEWGAFGESSGDLDSLRTEIDDMVDQQSSNPGKDTFTKLVCGLYIGEIVRLILAKLHQVLRFPFDIRQWQNFGFYEVNKKSFRSIIVTQNVSTRGYVPKSLVDYKTIRRFSTCSCFLSAQISTTRP